MENSEIVNDNQLKEKFKLLLIVPAFIGDLPRLYKSKFGEDLHIDGGLLKFVDSCAFLNLQGSHVEYTESKSDPIGDNLLFGTLEGRLKFLLPKSRALFYEELPKLYKLVFDETFESGPHLLHFIENYPCLKIDSFIFVSYNDQEAVNPRPPGNPRHKNFLTKRFIYLLRLFPKSPADLAALYKQNFEEDLPVKVNLLPAIFKNFLSDYFTVSSSNMIWFSKPCTTPKEQPEIPPELLGTTNSDSGNGPHPVIDRLIYLKNTRRLESKYIQFMYYDVFGEPITDFAMLKQFINAAYESTTEYCLDAYDLAQVYEPDKEPSFHDTLKTFLLTGPKQIKEVLDTCHPSRGFPIEISNTENAFKEVLLGIPGVLIRGTVVELAPNSLTYVNRQLCAIVQVSNTKLSDLPRLFKESYGYTIPDDNLLREYVLASDALQIDENGIVMKKSVIKQPTEKAPSSPPIAVKLPPEKAPSPPVTASTNNEKRFSPYVFNKEQDKMQKSNILKLLEKRATRLDRVREEYKQHFGHNLVLEMKLSEWIQTVEGINLDLETHMVSSDKMQKSNILKLLEKRVTRLDRVREEYKQLFGHNLVLEMKLSEWIQTVEGINLDLETHMVSSDKMQKSNVLKLLKKRATRLDRIREEYKQRFGHDLVLDMELSEWIQTIEGIDLDMKTQMVSSGLSEHQVKVIALLLDVKEVDFDQIPAQCKKKFGKDLTFKGHLKPWLCNIPGIVIAPSKMCTYNQNLTGGSMLDLSPKKLVSKLSISTPDIRPRSEEEQAVDVIAAHPNSTLNDFLKRFKEHHGKVPSYGGKLKSWLLSIPGVQVSAKDTISLQAKDVATNAKQNVVEILKHNKWVPVEVFAEDYKKLFGVSGSLTWIQSRQKEIDFLMLLNNNVRYEKLNAKTIIQYVKYLAKLFDGISVQQVDGLFPLVYGFKLPASMHDMIKGSFPTGEIKAGQCVDLKSEIHENLRNLDPSRARVLLQLMQTKCWIRIEDLIRDTNVQIQKMSESAFCESIPNVMMKNSRVKYCNLTPTILMAGVERIVSWLSVVQVSALPMLFKRLFGISVTLERLPLNNFGSSPHLEVVGTHLRTKTPHRLSAVKPIAPAELINHSENQLHRLFRIVSENPDIKLVELEGTYEEKFGAPIISVLPSFKLFVDAHTEFTVNNSKVTLTVPLGHALRDLQMNQLSSAQSISKPMQMSKMNISTIDPQSGSTRVPGESSNVSNTTTDNISSSDSHSDASIATKPSNVQLRRSHLKPTESSFFDSLIGNREKSIKTLCNDYKNKFKRSIAEEELEQLLITAGYCCAGGNVHYSCKQRLLFLLSARALSQNEVITEFIALFSRSPCYDGTLRKYLLSLGCKESGEKLFRFPLKGDSSVKRPNPELIERLLPLMEFRNRSFQVPTILDEYNQQFDPPLTEADFVAELKELDFVILTKKKKVFDCGGIHEASFEAMSEYLKRDSENTFSLSDLAQELPAKTGTKLMYFGNLLRALQHLGFYVLSDKISHAAKPDSSVSATPAAEKLAAPGDLMEIERMIMIKDLLRMESSLKYEELEKDLIEFSDTE